MTASPPHAKTVLIILDGFGIGANTPFNAIANAKMPFYQELLKKYPHSQLLTHGAAVGLPDGVMGNSEVGHMTMGAGRIIYQDLTRISKSIQDKTFFANPTLEKTLMAGASGTVHLMGLVSDGGVHSHLDHLLALLDFCQKLRIPRVSVHVFTDGRDTPPNSGVTYLQTLLRHSAFHTDGATPSPTQAKIATIGGRYYGMDRDQRWDRVEKAYDVLTGSTPAVSSDGPKAADFRLEALKALEQSYAAGKSDEFVVPLCLDAEGVIKDGDSVVFFNYRSDRARELSQAFTDASFSGFARKKTPRLAAFAGMTVYDRSLPLAAAYGSQNLDHLFGSWLEDRSLTQFRIAETEKYAHVTFFFNGGREAPFRGEDRVLIPSPKDVATYDLKPEMSALQVAQEAVTRIESGRYDFVLMNFANADMVGHTGNYAAAIRAMETLDLCLSQVIGAAQKQNYHVIVTADHGNAEEMQDCNGHLHTQHTLNPVPALWITPGSAIAPQSSRLALRDGGLQDIMPTLCDLMGLPLPTEVTGKSLLPSRR